MNLLFWQKFVSLFMGDYELKNQSARSAIRKRKLGFEMLEERQLLSAGGFDDDSLFDQSAYHSSETYSNSNTNSSESDIDSTIASLNLGLSSLQPAYAFYEEFTPISSPLREITDADSLSALNAISIDGSFRAVFKANDVMKWNYIFTHDTGTNNSTELFLRIRDGNLQFGYWTGKYTGNTNIIAQWTVANNTLYDVVGTHDENNFKLYVNGELKATTADTRTDKTITVSNTTVDNTTYPSVWLIGSHGAVGDRRKFDGTIYGIEVYNTTLAANDVEDLYNATWQVNLSGPTATGGVTPIFAEATQDSFDVTISRATSEIYTNTNYAVDFKLTFSGEATKSDFEIYDGTTLISDNASRWSSNDTVFSYLIEAGQTSKTLTFKLVDNTEVESSVENLTIAITNATTTINGTSTSLPCSEDTNNVAIKNDSFTTKWQTITGTDANKATLSADEEGRGQRVFPEKSTPTGEIENKIELVFTLEAAATADITLYFKIFDPDNFIGLGNDNNAANSWLGDDNYAIQNILNPISVEIAAGQQTATLTVVFYPDMYSGMKLIGDENTIVIESAHAGDNFIVVVDTIQTKINIAQLGITEPTRYKEKNNLTQSELLTVWRNLNVELDVANWTGMPAGNLKAPLDGFVATELARACIATKEFTPNNTSAPNVGDDGVDQTEITSIYGNGAGSGRDISGNSADFWTIRIVTIPYLKGETTYAGGFYKTTNTIVICHQTINDAVTSWNNANDPDVDLQESIRRNVLHEIGHVLLNGDDSDHTTDSSIMKTELDMDQRLSPNNRKFLVSQIKLLQQFSRANQ